MSKSPFFIAFGKVLGVLLKQHPCIYWISYVLFLSHIMISFLIYVLASNLLGCCLQMLRWLTFFYCKCFLLSRIILFNICFMCDRLAIIYEYFHIPIRCMHLFGHKRDVAESVNFY